MHSLAYLQSDQRNQLPFFNDGAWGRRNVEKTVLGCRAESFKSKRIKYFLIRTARSEQHKNEKKKPQFHDPFR